MVKSCQSFSLQVYWLQPTISSFFWVARMYFQTLYQTQNIPFKQVLIHGLIRDSQGRKMSKSLGNGIEPMEVIEEYGADALRLFLLFHTTPGNDIKFSYTKIKAA